MFLAGLSLNYGLNWVVLWTKVLDWIMDQIWLKYGLSWVGLLTRLKYELGWVELLTR